MSRLGKKVMEVAERELGGIGPSFLAKQLERLGLSADDLAEEKLNDLATEASRNCVLLVGKVRAENLKQSIMGLAS